MSTGLRITQVVLLLIGVMTLYGCGSADNTDNNNNNMAEQNLSSTNNISNQEDNIRKNEYSGDNMQSDKDSNNKYTKDTRVIDVINDEALSLPLKKNIPVFCFSGSSAFSLSLYIS